AVDLAHPADLQRGRQPRALRARSAPPARHRHRRRAPAPDRRRLVPGRHGRDRRSARRRARGRRGHAPPGQGRARARLPRRLRPRARRRRGARDGDRLRLLPRSGRHPAPGPGDRRSRPGARLALHARRWGGELGQRAAAAQPRRLVVRAHRARRADPRPHRRLQVLPPRGPRRPRARERARRRLRLPDRAHLPRARGGLPGPRGADRLPRAPRGGVEDDHADRLGSGLEGSGAAAARALRGGRARLL
ncbi:MAG: Undecaprenyl-phosphate mannosyltransferase, partial [uncultured Solirubrobacterales bacterium]